jgi:hypothetical protein
MLRALNRDGYQLGMHVRTFRRRLVELEDAAEKRSRAAQ